MSVIDTSESLDGSVGIVIRLRAGRSGVRIPALARDFLSSPKRPDRLWAPPGLLFNRYRELKR